MNKIRTVFSFEYRGYIKSKPFIITTIIFVAVILIGSQVPSFLSTFEDIGTLIGGGEKQKALIWVSGEAGDDVAGSAEEESIIAALDPKALDEQTGGIYEWQKFDPAKDYEKEPGNVSSSAPDKAVAGSESAAVMSFSPGKAVEDGKYAIVLSYRGGGQYDVYGKGQDFALLAVPAMLDPYITNAVREAKMIGMPPEQKAEVKAILDMTVAGEIKTVGGGDAENNFWLAYVMLYVLFISIMMYCQFIVNSVISEKSSKTMELLVTSAKPIQLMFGKVLGVGFAAFTQIGAIIIAVIVGFVAALATWEQNIPGFKEMLTQMNISTGLLVFFILFFVIGYFLYAFISAAMGSTASRVEDAGSVSTLPSMLAVLSFVVSMISMSNIDAAYVKVLSFIPLFSPWIMFGRLCMASATFTEAAIAIVILIATVFFFGWLAAKIYRVGVMMYGKPMKLRAVIKAAVRS
ncbi:MAG: ABC transporter permease [Clostridiales Family XIII bacterium]|nr:ABC transporter permease [Clostridiales Family XIII bacterium]